MQCEQCRKVLEGEATPATQTLQEDEVHGQLVHHLKDCPSCRDYAEELRIRRLLRTMPLPSPRRGFADEAISNALQHRRPVRTGTAAIPGWLGAAAAILVAVFLTAQFPLSLDSNRLDANHVQQLSVVKPVAVMFTSPKDIEGATITIKVDANMAIQGYGEGQPVSWKTSLKAGANKLTLPILLQDTDHGTLRIELEYSGVQRSLLVPVQPSDTRSTI